MAAGQREQRMRHAPPSPGDGGPDDRVDRYRGAEEATEPKQRVGEERAFRLVEIAILGREEGEGSVERVGEAAADIGLGAGLPRTKTGQREPAEDEQQEDDRLADRAAMAALRRPDGHTCGEVGRWQLFVRIHAFSYSPARAAANSSRRSNCRKVMQTNSRDSA